MLTLLLLLFIPIIQTGGISVGLEINVYELDMWSSVFSFCFMFNIQLKAESRFNIIYSHFGTFALYEALQIVYKKTNEVKNTQPFLNVSRKRYRLYIQHTKRNIYMKMVNDRNTHAQVTSQDNFRMFIRKLTSCWPWLWCTIQLWFLAYFPSRRQNFSSRSAPQMWTLVHVGRAHLRTTVQAIEY
jgi:hypothetical protein